jgi:hypothetical protein
LPGAELGKSMLVAAAAGGLAYAVGRAVAATGGRMADLAALTLTTLTWAAAVAAGLWLTGSDLPGLLRRRLRLDG